MNFLNSLQKVCRKHIVLLSFIQLLFVFFGQGVSAKNTPSAASVGDDGCTAPIVSVYVSGELTCISSFVVLNATSSTPNAIYSWSGPNAFASTAQSPVVNVPGTYTVTVMAPNGCSAKASVTVGKNTEPPANVTATVSGSLKSGSEVTLTGASSTQNVVYQWSGPEGFFSPKQEEKVRLPGTYILMVINFDNGCSTSKDILVN